MNALGSLLSVNPDYQGVLIVQVSLQMHAKIPIGTRTKCLDYASPDFVLI